MKQITCLFLLLFIFLPRESFSSATDYYDRLLIYQGIEKGILYREGRADSSALYLKAALGYGLDDDKILNMNLSFDKDFERVFLFPEFVLLINEFSRIKFYLTAGPDFGIKNNFETALRTSQGVIFDIFSNLSFLLGIDTRFNIYDRFYIESLGLFSVIIRI